MNNDILVLIDRGAGSWIMQYRDAQGMMIVETTEFPANTPSIVVCDAVMRAKPGAAVFAKLT
jgi:hypothetical protein